MEKYTAKRSKISILVFKFSFFLVALIVIPKTNILSGFIESVWGYLLGAILILAFIEIVIYFKKGEDYIEVTETGLKLESIFGVIQEGKFTDTFKYNYRRKKLKSIVVSNEKKKAVLVAFNRYEIELSELKDKIEKRQEALNTENN